MQALASYGNRKYRSFLAASLLLLWLAGCGGTHKPFVPLDQLTVRPATLAVISGGVDEATVSLADYLTAELAARTRFKVIDQEKISSRAGKYPLNLKRNVDAFAADKPVWLAHEDRKKLDALQKALKADYLFVVWAHGLSFVSGRSASYYVTVLGNFYEYPGGHARAFTRDDNKKGMSLFKGQAHDINAMLKDSARKVADAFIDAAGVAK